jgi:hypothetical protein
VTEVGVPLPAEVISVLDVSRSVFGGTRDSGDWTFAVDGVLTGKGGNADEGAFLRGVSTTTDPVALGINFEGTAIFRLGVERFSAALVDDCATGMLPERPTVFLFTIGALLDAVATVCLPLPDSRAGKSSDWRTG